jgi:hypothetical protein
MISVKVLAAACVSFAALASLLAFLDRGCAEAIKATQRTAKTTTTVRRKTLIE